MNKKNPPPITPTDSENSAENPKLGRAEVNRRSFLKNSMVAGAAVTAGAGMLGGLPSALAQEGHEHITRGDAALLRFAAAAEILETDFWVQYNELAGVQDDEVPGGSGNSLYAAALASVDDDNGQYIHDNTDDEFTHQNFLNAYLESKGFPSVDLERFRTLKIDLVDGILGTDGQPLKPWTLTFALGGS